MTSSGYKKQKLMMLILIYQYKGTKSFLITELVFRDTGQRGSHLLLKKACCHIFQVDQSKPSKLILFFTVSKEIYDMEYCEQDLVCGIVYIPPLGSKYTNDDPYLEMKEEIFRYCSDRKHVLLFGDFNSHSKALPDYVKLDEYM